MAPRLVLFVGAPEANTLKWDENDLLNAFEEPIARFAGIQKEITPTTPDLIRATIEIIPPAWRSIPLERQPLKTGFEQSFEGDVSLTRAPPAQGWLQNSQGTTFFTASQIEEEFSQPQIAESFGSVASVSAEQVLSQFYEESYIRHEDTPSSQLAPASDFGTSISASFSSSSFSSQSFESSAGQNVVKDFPTVGQIHSLSSIPNVNYLNSIQPQTMTVNLIVGIISIPPARLIRTRRGANVELIEVLVGDETKSGFGINFWLRTSESQAQGQSGSVPGPGQSEMGKVLRGLRPQDVILVKNVALSSFRNKVYGQSLRKEMTRVCLLYRNRVDKSDVGGLYSRADLEAGLGNAQGLASAQIQKTSRVREWVMRFVGVAASGQNKGKGREKEIVGEVLPADTQ